MGKPPTPAAQGSTAGEYRYYFAFLWVPVFPNPRKSVWLAADSRRLQNAVSGCTFRPTAKQKPNIGLGQGGNGNVQKVFIKNFT